MTPECLDISRTSKSSSLSEFQYNLETILTGVSEDGTIITDGTFKKVNNKAEGNITRLATKLRSLVANMGNSRT